MPWYRVEVTRTLKATGFWKAETPQAAGELAEMNYCDDEAEWQNLEVTGCVEVPASEVAA
jgi:hypothetical protein